MKAVFTGSGKGGHFYPILAIIEALREIEEHENVINAEIHYMGDQPFDERVLYENQVIYKEILSGKNRLYFSLKNIIDIFKIFFGTLSALMYLFHVYPDVVFSKGGYVSFPVTMAARLLRIPVIIHESDSVPGRANIIASKWAKSIALSYPDAAKFFPEGKVVYTGNPVRKEILHPVAEGAREFLKLSSDLPVILVLGGSQGAEKINDAILGVLPELLQRYQIIHQVGDANVKIIESILGGILTPETKGRYKYFGHMNDLAMKMGAGACNLIVSRAGSALFEIAAWGKPAIVIPIAQSNGDHQTKNAYNFTRSGAGEVIEESNLSPHLLLSEIDRTMGDPQRLQEMAEASKSFSNLDASMKIARQILAIAQEHDKEDAKRK